MTVIGIRLITGEELIARCKNIGGDLEVEMARVIGLQETPQGVGLGFMPWTLGNPDSTVMIKGEHVIATYTPKAEIEKAFLSQTSKIALMG